MALAALRVRVRTLVLSVGLAAAIALASALPAGAASPPKVYVALGDSVAVAGSATHQRYPERFFATLRRRGAANVLDNIAVSGETSSSLRGNQLKSAVRLINAVNTDTTVVTVTIGGNDDLGDPRCDARSPSLSLAACQATLQRVADNEAALLEALNAALAHDPGAERVIAMTYYNPWSGRSGDEATAINAALSLLGTDARIDCSGSDAARGLNDVIACVALRHGATVADVYGPFVGQGSKWFFDEVHPDDAGHAAIAAVFASAFASGPDITPPILHLPTARAVDATSRVGAVVTYSATATDDRDAKPSLGCAPRSGARIAIGRTVVACTATDAAGHRTTGSFRVVIRGAGSQLHRLVGRVGSLRVPRALTRRLGGPLRQALAKLHARQKSGACRRLAQFSRRVRARTGGKIRAGAAAGLVARSRRIRAVLAC